MDVNSAIVNEKGLLEALPALTVRQLRKLRSQRKLPYLKLGHRTFLYDPERVIAAPRKLEVSE